MIGTTSVMESNEEILYPSISACSIRPGDKHYNASHTSQRSLNLSSIIAYAGFFKKNESGHIEKQIIATTKEGLKDRDENFH